MDWWQPRVLGRTGLRVSRLGLGSSYGLAGKDVERAVERGVTYLYWGSRRRDDFGDGIRRCARRDRDRLCVVVQSYSRSALALGPSLEVALRRLGLDHADVLLLGWWNQPPPRRILDRARELVERGRARALMISCHHRPAFAAHIAAPAVDAIMVRYNAAHRGAEHEVFPHVVAAARRPGVVAYTATRWGGLLDRALVPAAEPVPRASDCYRFALTRPEVDVVLAGPRDGAELDEALAALDRGPLTADELAWLQRVGDGVRAASSTGVPPPGARNAGALWERVVGAAQQLGSRLRR
ncbi:MAG: aldo/keto reductase [Kofleriaceae bacterium]|nr:aldo/keto reductase [Kofleriaceae bacterium]MCL4223100.1 aldo/keto reductase [Myxococcales bacterium]